MVNFLRLISLLIVFISSAFFIPNVYADFEPSVNWKGWQNGCEGSDIISVAICSFTSQHGTDKFSECSIVSQTSISAVVKCKYTPNGNFLSGSLSKNLICSAGSVLNNGQCSCPAGSEEVGDSCQPPCTADEIRVDGVCKPKNPCPEGEEEQGGACVPKKCKPDETRVNGLCVPEPPCPPGESRINGVCKKNGCQAGKEAGQFTDLDENVPYYTCEGDCQVRVLADICVGWEDDKGVRHKECTGTGKFTGAKCSPGGDGSGGPNKPKDDGGNGGNGGGKGEGGGGTGGGGTGGTGTGGTGAGGTGTGGTGTGTGGTGTGGTGTGGTGTGTGGTGTGGTGGTGTGGTGTGGTGGTGTGGTGSGSGAGSGGPTLPKPKPPVDPDADGKCPAGTNKQGKVCVQDKQDPDKDGKCVEGFVKINNMCYATRPADKGSDGDGDDDDDGDKSVFGGACAAGFTCEGDAIQCAISKEQHIRNCKLFDEKSAESELYEKEKGKEGNQTDKLEGNETIDMNGRIDSSDALGGGSGVQNLNLTVAGHSVTLPLSDLNSPLAALGNLLVAVSFIIAVRIIGRG